MTAIKTFSPNNKFRFACPIFGAEVAIAGCLSLRDTVWRGQRVEERRGCTACMRASKCPIPRLVSQITRTGEDPYFSAEPTVGRLKPELLSHIGPILVSAHLLDEEQVPDSEREMILAANEAVSSRKGAARAPKPIEHLAEVERRPARAKPAAKTDALDAAAASGDMSEAITRAISRSSVPAEKAASPTKSSEKVTSGHEPEKVPAIVKPAPTPPRANVASAKPSEIANSRNSDTPPKPMTLLERARARKAAA